MNLKKRNTTKNSFISRRIVCCLGMFMLLSQVVGQHTFSIVAIDPATGQVGGAGATCYATVNDIADVHPGVGFIHTQSYVNYQNQAFAKNLMDQGFSPQEIMDTLSLYSVDADNAPSYRQYTAIDLVNGGRSAAFSGQDCFDYKGHRLGQTYAIAGNILLGPEVLDSMESRFLNTQGTLAEKLMSSLQGAKIQGADKRCIDSMVSSLSAYLIVSKPSDLAPNYYINLNVENVMPQDPIDVLQTQFDALGLSSFDKNILEKDVKVYPNPVNKNGILYIDSQSYIIDQMTLYNSIGEITWFTDVAFHIQEINGLDSGIYFYELYNNKKRKRYSGKVIVN
jgi:uncharacterized Ntn-hydrolase superfamily protein